MFHGLDPECVNALAKRLTPISLEPNVVFIHKGQVLRLCPIHLLCFHKQTPDFRTHQKIFAAELMQRAVRACPQVGQEMYFIKQGVAEMLPELDQVKLQAPRISTLVKKNCAGCCAVFCIATSSADVLLWYHVTRPLSARKQTALSWARWRY